MIYILCKRRYIGRESRSLFIPQNGGHAVKGLCVKQMRLLLYSSAFERIKKVLINKSRRLSPSACSIFFRELPWRQRGSLLHCYPQYNSLTSWQTSIKTFEIAIEREKVKISNCCKFWPWRRNWRWRENVRCISEIDTAIENCVSTIRITVKDVKSGRILFLLVLPMKITWGAG